MVKSVSSWNDITVGMYIELYDILIEPSESKTFEIISLFYDISMDEVEALDFETYIDIESKLDFINKPISKASDSFELSGITFQLIDFNMIEFGAFIDLEALITDKENIIRNTPKIFSILYRPILKEETLLHKAVLDPYGDWLDKRVPLFESVPISLVYNSISEYTKFRNMLYEQYQGMFETKEEMSDEDIKQLELEKMHMTDTESKEEEKLERVNKWGWELLLLKLANNEPLNIEAATMMPLLQAFNILSMAHELGLSGE